MILLVRGVGMGATGTADPGAGGVARLMMMGVGRMWWIPFLLIMGG